MEENPQISLFDSRSVILRVLDFCSKPTLQFVSPEGATIPRVLFTILTFAALASCSRGAFAQADNSTDTTGSFLRNGGANTHVENVTELNSPYDDAATIISSDENSIYFTSFRDGNKMAVYVAHRISKTAWGTPEKFADLPGKENIGGISISADGQHAVMSCCNRPDGILGSCDLYEGDVVDGKLTNIHSMGRSINSEWWEGQTSLSQDGQLLFFASDRKHGHGGVDIYMCAKTASGTWSEPVDLDFNSSGNDCSPTIASDNETLYFASGGFPGGLGGYDIYVTHRTGPNSWTTPKNLGPAVNSKKDDMFFSIPQAEDAVYLTSNREGGLGGFDIYRVSPNPIKPLPKIIALRGTVLDAETNQLVKSTPDVQISLSSTGEVFQNTGQAAQYGAIVPLSGLIKIRASAEGYVTGSIEVQAPANRDTNGFVQDIKLTPAHARIDGHVSNAFSHKPLETKVLLEELAADQSTVKRTASYDTKSDGAYSFTLTPGSKYRLSTVVKNYDPYGVVVDVPITQEATQRLVKEIYMTPSDIKAVMVFFEFNKRDLKTDQEPKLSHFIEQVKQNPNVRIEVHGHTDSVGTVEYNATLSEDRAVAVQDYLLSQGVPQDQLALVKGFGFAEPIASNATPEGAAMNRRVEVRIVGKQ
jgi:outer membrane protein OmpA-like peptidoglycan-associated protein